MGTEGDRVGLTLNCQTYPADDGTWTVDIAVVWDKGEHAVEHFYDYGYTSIETAESYMKVKAKQIKELMEQM